MTQKTKTNFWSRLISFIIDLSMIYGIAFILFNLLQLFHFYILTVRLSLIIAILYFPIITILFKASIGKILCGIKVENNSMSKYSIAIFLREVVYKQLLYILPIYGLITYYKLEWLSPFFEIVCVLILSMILFIVFLFRKKTWYDEWAKTIVVRNVDYDKVHAKKGIAFLFGIILIVMTIRVSYFISEKTFNGTLVPKHPKNVTAPYVSFLEKQKDAKDYIFKLFEKKDIVILCERAHPEMTQYDFIYDIISDKRFIENVGNVCSEIGSTTQQANLDSLMNTDSLSNDELELKLVKILRNYSYYPIWENTNYFNYFKKLYTLNQKLPKEQRIQHSFTDIKCNWKRITNKKDYSKIKSDMRMRDKILADNVISKYEGMLSSNHVRRKCLVIMNYRHAFGPVTIQDDQANWENCAAYIMNKYPDKAANIMLNQVKLSFGLSNPGFPLFFMPFQFSPIKEGIWDYSFKEIGNKSLGFDFNKSPFGRDKFDLFIVPNRNGFKYQDIFTGFVFYKPLEEHYFSLGFKNIITNGFDEEILNRATRIDDSDLDNNIKYWKGKVKMLRKQEITIDNHPYQVFRSVFELIFGTMILILGLISGLAFFITKRKITKA